MPCPRLGDLPNPGTEPRSPTLQADSSLSEPPGKPFLCIKTSKNLLQKKVKYQHVKSSILVSTYRKSYLGPEQTVLLPRWHSGKEATYQRRLCKRLWFDLWVWKIPWRRKWQPAPVFLPRDLHGQRSLVGYSPRGCKERGMTER